jgi:hypothetical protein
MNAKFLQINKVGGTFLVTEKGRLKFLYLPCTSRTRLEGVRIMGRTFRLPLFAATLVALVAPLALAVPASADHGTQLCLFQHRDFEGDWQCSSPGPFNIVPYLDDQVSSLWNNTDTTLCAFEHPDQGGYQLPVGPDRYFKNLAWDTAPDGNSWNDRISSVVYCRT